MSWFFIALLAHFLWSAVNLADQYLVKRFKENETSNVALLMFVGICALILSIVICAIKYSEITQFSTHAIIFLVISGIVQIAGIAWYLQAFMYEEASHIMAWFLLLPVFGYIFGFLFLGESLLLAQVAGIGVIIAGALVFSTRYDKTTSKHSVSWKMIVCVVMASAILALGDVFFKKGTPDASLFWSTLGVHQLGVAAAGLLLFVIPRWRTEFVRTITKQGKMLVAVSGISEIATITGSALKFLAILYAPVALVQSLEAYQPLIVYVMTIPMTFMLPAYFSFEFSKRSVLLKIIGAALLIGGTYLLL